MLPHFFQLPSFTSEWDRLGMADDGLKKLERDLAADPTIGDVVPGTDGGLRKVRVKRPGKGKSGGLRVFYAHVPAVGVFLLGAVIDKTERADLTVKEARRVAKVLGLVAAFYNPE